MDTEAGMEVDMAVDTVMEVDMAVDTDMVVDMVVMEVDGEAKVSSL